LNCAEELVGIHDVGRESLDKRLDLEVKEGGDSFSVRANTGNYGSSRTTRFMDFGK